MAKKSRKPQGSQPQDNQNKNVSRFDNKNRGLYETPSRTMQKLSKLEELRKETQEKLLFRLQLVSEVLEDNDWISVQYQGDRDLAREELMRRHFFTLRGYISLHKLLDMYHTINADQWAECDYDVSAVEVIYDGLDKKPVTRNRYHNWKKECLDLRDECEQLRKELERWKQIAEERLDKIEAQNTEIKELASKLAHIEGRLEEIRSQSKAA